MGREQARMLLVAKGVRFQRTKTWIEPDHDSDTKLDRIEEVPPLGRAHLTHRVTDPRQRFPSRLSS